MDKFKLVSEYKPSGDQPEAVAKLAQAFGMKVLAYSRRGAEEFHTELDRMQESSGTRTAQWRHASTWLQMKSSKGETTS